MATLKNNPYPSPLRYPGSKRRLVGYIKEVLLLNSIRPLVYVEPFVGGGSVALQLLNDNLVEKVILMDLDPWVASFWEVLFSDTEWLIERIRKTPITLELWNEIKKSNPTTTREKAWACFYLNRTSFSGILEGKVGPLGGKEQASEYKIDCRFPKESLILRVMEAAKHKEKVHAIWNCSWAAGIEQLRKEQAAGRLLTQDLFFYFDPPFFEKAESLYRFYFCEQDHVALRDFLLTLSDSWVLSYDSAAQVEKLYGDAINSKSNGTNRQHVDLYYSLAQMSERRTAKEVIISNMPILPT